MKEFGAGCSTMRWDARHDGNYAWRDKQIIQERDVEDRQ